METWKLLVGSVVAAAWGALAILNVGAWFLNDWAREYQITVAIFAAVLDVGALGASFGFVKMKAAGRGGKAVACLMAAIILSVFECGGAWHASCFLTGKIAAPSSLAAEESKSALDMLTDEKANLAEIRKQLKNERRVSLVKALQKREAASIKRIDGLAPKTHTSTNVAAPNLIAGYEWAAVLALWLLYQICAYAITDDAQTGRKSGTNWGVVNGVPEQGVSREQSVHVHPVPSVHVHPETPLIEAQIQPAKVYSQDVVPIEDEHQPEQSERGVHAQPKHGVPSVQKGRPVLGLVPKDEFADAVYMHTLNGKSVRAIARLLNCSPTKVQNAKKKLEEEGRIATSSSA